MPRNTQTLNGQRRTNKFPIGFALASLLFAFGSSSVARAATIPFTFELTYDVFVVGVPSPSTLTLPTTVSGSGSFAPFGPAIYSEAGTVTFESSPSGELVTSTVTNNLIASFNGSLWNSKNPRVVKTRYIFRYTSRISDPERHCK